MAQQGCVAIEVHRVHLGEMRIPDQHVPGSDQHGAAWIAFRPEPVALCHQRRGRRQRQELEPAVLANRAEVGRIGRIAALVQDLLERDLVARRLLALLGAQPGVDLEPLVFLVDHRFDLRRGRGLHGAVEIAGRDHAQLWPQLAQHRGFIHADVAHAIHRVAEDGDLHPPQGADRGRGARPVLEGALEFRRLPVIGDDRQGHPGPHQGIGLILSAVDALVIGHVAHVPLVGDVALRLGVRQHQRQARVDQGARDIHRRAIGQHHHHDAVHAVALEPGDDLFRVGPVAHRLGEDDLRHIRKLLGDGASVIRLALGDPWQHSIVQFLHDAHQTNSRFHSVFSFTPSIQYSDWQNG